MLSFPMSHLKPKHTTTDMVHYNAEGFQNQYPNSGFNIEIVCINIPFSDITTDQSSIQKLHMSFGCWLKLK